MLEIGEDEEEGYWCGWNEPQIIYYDNHLFFFFNDTATTEIYTLSLHDALPISTLGVQDTIKYAVDIDPYKNGMYMAGTGQQIVSPEFLKEYKPDVVIVMNPIYFNEIRQYLGRMEVSTKLMPVG